MSSISQPIGQVSRVQQGGLTFKQRRQLQNAVRYVILTILIIFAVFPVLWIVSASLNPLQSMASQRLIPNVSDPALLLKNYTDLLGNPDRYPFFRWLLNSTLVASVTAIGIVSITRRRRTPSRASTSEGGATCCCSCSWCRSSRTCWRWSRSS